MSENESPEKWSEINKFLENRSAKDEVSKPTEQETNSENTDKTQELLNEIDEDLLTRDIVDLLEPFQDSVDKEYLEIARKHIEDARTLVDPNTNEQMQQYQKAIASKSIKAILSMLPSRETELE